MFHETFGVLLYEDVLCFGERETESEPVEVFFSAWLLLMKLFNELAGV